MVTVRSGVFLEAVFWIFEEGAALFHGGHRLWGFGEGLGGGYRPPLNERDVEQSELIFGGSEGWNALLSHCSRQRFARPRDRRYYLK